MGWLITLGMFSALAVLPLGVRIRYDAQGIRALIIAGPVKITVYPRPPKAKKAKKDQKKKGSSDPKPDPLPQPPQPPKPEKPAEKKESGGSLLDFLPLVKVVLDFLGDFRRKLRMDDLQLKLILAGQDPCDLAVNYGRTWAALGNLMPQLERLFVIKKRNIEVECDFTAAQTLVTAGVDITITLGRLIALAVVYAVKLLCEFMKIKKKRKGGASK